MPALLSIEAGPALDYLVAQVDGTLPATFDDWQQRWPAYSQDWGVTGPLIRKYGISLLCKEHNAEWHATRLTVPYPHHKVVTIRWHPSDPLIAVCRCIIASVLGDNPHVPEELT